MTSEYGVEFVCSHCGCPSSAHYPVYVSESWKGAWIAVGPQGRHAIRRCARCERSGKPCHGVYPALDPRTDGDKIRALKSAAP